MKKIIVLLVFLVPICGFTQNSQLSEYQKADILLKTNNIDSAYAKFKKLESTLSKSDTLYKKALWYYIMTASQLEKENRLNEKFENSLSYGNEALKAIEKGMKLFDPEFAKRKYFMMKNIVVSNSGMGNFIEAAKWKKLLYKAKDDNILPEGLDEYFNFDYFTFENKNIWGYEWFEKLPKDRFGSSFTKIVYYVYSTDENGEDKDQLYRLHVLMFHGTNMKFDYVMTKRLETATDEASGTLYSYTYNEDIDFPQLQLDIKEILNGNLSPKERKKVILKK